MTDKNDGKPDDGAAGKRPKPLLDLKATEIHKPASGGGIKPTESSTLKGAPGWKEPTRDAKPASSAPPSGSASATASSPGAKPEGGTAATASTASGQPSTPVRAPSAAAPDSWTSGSTAGSAAAAGSAGARDGRAGKSETATRSPGAATSAKPAQTGGSAARSSGTGAVQAAPSRQGGGFFSTPTHLAAGLIGGGIALTAAGPLDRELGLGLSPKVEVPAALQQRLSALESRPIDQGIDTATKNSVARLSEKMAAAEQKIAEIDMLGKQVATLAGDLKKVQVSGTPTVAGGEQTAQLRTRLAKLESALATLSSATGASGQASGIAPLAQFSGKIADLESSLATQIGSLRKSFTTEMDSRMSRTSDAMAKALASADRLDREVSDIKTEAARLEQRSAVLKTASDKLAATVRAVGEQTAEIKVELDTFKGGINQELTKVARPADVNQAIVPVSEKVAAIEKNVGSLIASETARKSNAERIVLSLELSSLKRVLDRGQPYAAELADVKKIAGAAIDFAALDAHQGEGVPSGQELARQFRGVAYQIINAEAAPKDDASRIDKLFAAAKSIVKVRRTDIPPEEKTTEAAVARIETQLKAGDVSGALALAEKLPQKSKAPAQVWISKLAARAGIDRAIAKLEDQLKASLGAGPQTDKKG